MPPPKSVGAAAATIQELALHFHSNCVSIMLLPLLPPHPSPNHLTPKASRSIISIVDHCYICEFRNANIYTNTNITAYVHRYVQYMYTCIYVYIYMYISTHVCVCASSDIVQGTRRSKRTSMQHEGTDMASARRKPTKATSKNLQ